MPLAEAAPEQQAAIVTGVITPAEAMVLHNLSNEQITGAEPVDEGTRALLDTLGAGSDGNYALVMDEDDKGNSVPVGFISLGDEDLGTRVRPDNEAGLGLPEPGDAYASWGAAHAEGNSGEVDENASGPTEATPAPEATAGVQDELVRADATLTDAEAYVRVANDQANMEQPVITDLRRELYALQEALGSPDGVDQAELVGQARLLMQRAEETVGTFRQYAHTNVEEAAARMRPFEANPALQGQEQAARVAGVMQRVRDAVAPLGDGGYQELFGAMQQARAGLSNDYVTAAEAQQSLTYLQAGLDTYATVNTQVVFNARNILADARKALASI